jgi:hypothetical protein
VKVQRQVLLFTGAEENGPGGGSTSSPGSTVLFPQVVDRQTPLMQVAPPVHALPQAPQFVLLVWVFTQTLEQLVRPPVQTTVHDPAEQTCPPGQTLPQVPQLLTSLWRSRQTLEQLVCPLPQRVRHMPPEHEVSPVHTLPQAPQFWLLFCRSLQVPEQLVCPLPQVVVQTLLTQA